MDINHKRPTAAQSSGSKKVAMPCCVVGKMVLVYRFEAGGDKGKSSHASPMLRFM